MAQAVAQETAHPDVAQVWQWLDTVPDPEIPVITLVELGIIRDIAFEGEKLVVTVTPTYSGCPATSIINLDISSALTQHGVTDFELRRRLSPPWTTDWISQRGQQRLLDYGIAPPQRSVSQPPCPRCGSPNTAEISRFGSTPCKASWRCNDCLEPFDRFKCI